VHKALESFDNIPDEVKNEDLLKKVREAKATLEQDAKVKLDLAQECGRMAEAIEAVLQRPPAPAGQSTGRKGKKAPEFDDE
jgi:hypothetical protein